MDKQKWISDKISLLIKEGYKQDQAVAIANSMYEKTYQGGGKTEAPSMWSAEYWAMPNPNEISGQGAAPNPSINQGFSFIQNNGLDGGKKDPFNVPSSMGNYLNNDFTFNPNVTPNPTQEGATTTTGRFQKPAPVTADMEFSDPSKLGLPTAPQTNEEKARQGNEIIGGVDNGLAAQTDDESTQFIPNPKIQFFNPYGGVDIPTAAGALGASIANKDTFGTVASSLKLATGLGRNVFGAMGAQNRENEVMKDYYQKQRDAMTITQNNENGGVIHKFQGGGMMASSNEELFPILPKPKRKFSTPMKEAIVNPTVSSVPQKVMTREEEDKTRAVQRAIQHIQKVETNEYKSNGSLPPGSYHKVYYTDPNKAKLENQDYEYIDNSGYQALQRMPNYRAYQEGLNKKQNPMVASFAEGGKMTVPKALTGEYMTGMDEQNPIGQPNAEIEKGEYLQHPDGSTQQVLGDTHEKGGEDVELEDGTKILSDHLKIGGAAAKQFRDDYDISVKASDTYATVLDKYSRKIGLTKLVEEQEEVIEKLGKQQKEVKDEETLGLNTQVLSNKINEIEEDRKPLEAQRDEVFNIVFEKQEASKPKSEKEDTGKFEVGGVVRELAAKYNVSEERAMEIAKGFFQNGGVQEQYPALDPTLGNIHSLTNPNNPLFAGSNDTFVNNRNAYEDPAGFIHQDEHGSGYFGNTVLYNSLDVQKEIKRLHPELYSQFFIEGKIKPENELGFQQAVNNKYDAILTDVATKFGEKSKQYNDLRVQMDKDKFLSDKSVRSFDAKFGNFTSTRPNYAIPALPKDVLLEVQNAGVTDAFKLKEAFPDYYDKYVGSKGMKSNFILGEEGKIPPPPASTPVQPAETPLPNEVADPPKVVEEDPNKNKLNLLLLPDQSPMLPDSLQAHLKLQRRFDRVDPALISPEQNIQELNRSASSVATQINNSAGAERMAALASLGANTGENINKVFNATETFNAQAKSRAEGQNAQIQAMEENARGQDALSYEQRQLRAKALTDNDVRNYYNRLQENNVQNFNKVNEFNLLNAMYDNFQFNGNTVENYGSTPQWSFNNGVPTQSAFERREAANEEIKANRKANKKKFGGRFKS